MINFEEARNMLKKANNEIFDEPIPLSNANIALCILSTEFSNNLLKDCGRTRLDLDYDRKSIEIKSLDDRFLFIPQLNTNKKYTSAEFVLVDFYDYSDKVILNFTINLERAITKQEISWLKGEELIDDEMEFTDKAIRYFSHSKFLFFIENGNGDLGGRLATKSVLNEIDDVIVDCLNYEVEIIKI